MAIPFAEKDKFKIISTIKRQLNATKKRFTFANRFLILLYYTFTIPGGVHSFLIDFSSGQ